MNHAVTLFSTQLTQQAVDGFLRIAAPLKHGINVNAQVRAKIMDERMRELCFEGWRRIDLLRTGQFVTLVKERNKWAKESGTIQDFHKRYPIPDTEIKTNDAFTEEDQNPGYN